MAGRDDPIRIAGAGPAGLAAAITVARAGRRAIVFERRRDVGLRFHGDHQGIENWTTAGDALDEIRSIGIAPDFVQATFSGANIYDARATEYRYRSAKPLFYMVRRGPDADTLDSGLKRQAMALGVEIRFGESRAPDECDIYAAGPRGAYAIVSGYVFQSNGTPGDGVYGVCADSLAPKGYSYLVVVGGKATVATCMFADLANYQRYLARTVEFFERRVGMSMRNPEPYGGTGVVWLPASARIGRTLHAGESIGFQDALWGFGIRMALVSGHLAGRAIVEGAPERFDDDWRRRFRGLIEASLVNRWWYERLGDLGYRLYLNRLQAAADARDFLRRRFEPSAVKSLWYPLVRRSVGFNQGLMRRV